MTLLKKIDYILTILFMVVVVFLVLGLIYDTVNAYIHPESYQYVQYQNNWKDEGFAGYVLGNISFIAGALIFGFFGYKKISKGGKLWRGLYYSSLIVLLVVVIANAVIAS